MQQTDQFGPQRSRPNQSHQDISKVAFIVGSAFHKCVCGSLAVFRAHQPGDIGWTHYCWDCSRKDEDTGFKTKFKKKVPFLVLKAAAPFTIRKVVS